MYVRFNWNLEELFVESNRGDTTGNEDMYNVERRANSSGANAGSPSAMTVKEAATDYATVL